MDRILRLQKELPDGTDGAIISSFVNRRYFTGFKSSAGTLLVTRDDALFIIDFRYIEAAKNAITDCKVVLQERLFEQIKDFFTSHGAKTVSVESGYTTLDEYSAFADSLKPIETLRDDRLNKTISDQRKIKSLKELEIMRQAQDLTDEAFAHILDFIKPGMTELEAALELEFFIRKRGAGTAFDFIVISGSKTSMPHGVPSDKKIERGDFITIDYGASVDGYCSDMTRTVAVGSVSDEQRKIYDITLDAQLKTLAAIKPGMVCSDVDKTARDIIYSAGYEGCFGHGLGHSVGLEIHEMPAFSMRCKDVAEPGMVITVEPGIYLEGKFGVRIEDVVCITANGCENITHSPKNLIII